MFMTTTTKKQHEQVHTKGVIKCDIYPTYNNPLPTPSLNQKKRLLAVNLIAFKQFHNVLSVENGPIKAGRFLNRNRVNILIRLASEVSSSSFAITPSRIASLLSCYFLHAHSHNASFDKRQTSVSYCTKTPVPTQDVSGYLLYVQHYSQPGYQLCLKLIIFIKRTPYMLATWSDRHKV